MKKSIFSVIALTLNVVALFANDEEKHNYKPSAGYVPNAATAIKIAVAVWEPIYGVEQIARERPYRVLLKKDVWIVEGSLPEDLNGGIAVAEISKDSGKILRVSHGK